MSSFFPGPLACGGLFALLSIVLSQQDQSRVRKLDLVVFLTVVLVIHGLVNFYIFVRGWEAIPNNSPLRDWYAAVFLVLALSFIVGRFLERVTLSWLSTACVWIGSYWLAAMVYLLLAVVVVDIVRLMDMFFPLIPSFITKEWTALAVTGLVAAVVFGGALNAGAPRIRRLAISIPKKTNPLTSLNIAVASDIHLGTIVCKHKLERIVRKINSLDPDVVLLPGDVVDEDIGPVIKQNLGETLRKIQSRFGVYAITGNHEYIGGVEAACTYLVDHGIRMLRDEVVRVADNVYIAGREDTSLNRWRGKKRKTLQELTKQIDKSLPLILMDHQPFRLEEAEKNGLDLQLSGHTHHGQLWPFNLITKKVYELSWGYKKKGATHVYVSCGAGTWGPPVRTGNRPEIVNITLTFTG